MSGRGGVRESGGKLYARARYGRSGRVERLVTWTADPEAVRARAEVMGEVLENVVAAGRKDLVRRMATKLAQAPTAKDLANVRKAISAVIHGAVKAASAYDTTIRVWGERYTSGDLARTYPDHVRAKDYADDASRLKNYVYPHVGDVPVAAFTIAHADLVMAKLPTETVRTPATRRHVAQVLSRILKLAVFPGRLIATSPIPAGWLPRLGKGKHRSCLFPAEEAQLLACTSVSLLLRLFFGVLNREGMRIGELWQSEWWQWNLDMAGEGDGGTFTATKTKTGDPRMWALTPDVVRAMRKLRALVTSRLGRAPARTDRPFAGLDGLGKSERFADALRDSLRYAKVDRAELFARGEHTAQLRAHDLRATFVTISLSQGKTETWVRDRTAHKSTSMIDRYRRLARQLEELNLGPLLPLDEALDWTGGGWLGDEVFSVDSTEPRKRRWYRRRDSNPHAQRAADFESADGHSGDPTSEEDPGDGEPPRRPKRGVPHASPTLSGASDGVSRRSESAPLDGGRRTLRLRALGPRGGTIAATGKAARGAERVTVHLPDGTIATTEIATGEPVKDIADRVALKLRQEGVPVDVRIGVTRGGSR